MTRYFTSHPRRAPRNRGRHLTRSQPRPSRTRAVDNVTGRSPASKGGTFEDLLRLPSRLGKSGDPVVRQQLADVYVRT